MAGTYQPNRPVLSQVGTNNIFQAWLKAWAGRNARNTSEVRHG